MRRCITAQSTPLLLRPLVMAQSQPSFNMLCDVTSFGFASRLAKKRIYVDKTKLLLPKSDQQPLEFRKPWDSTSKPMSIKVKKVTRQATVTR